METLTLNKTLDVNGEEIELRLELNRSTGKIVDAAYVEAHGKLKEIPAWFAEVLTGSQAWNVRCELLEQAEAQEVERV